MTKINPEDAFAAAYDVKFRSATSGLAFNEVPLFKAMHSALVGLSPKFHVEEYHGNAHQVRFTGNGSFARTKARCELSDLLIVTYSPTQNLCRLTYLQAKSERATLNLPWDRKFSANLEQWFLLSSRPSISGASGKFNPPNDLLSSALLGSVGSFGFFFKDQAGDFQTFYAAADYLKLGGRYSQRNGTLISRGPCVTLVQNGFSECRATSGNASFAKNLYMMKIGTPIGVAVKGSEVIRNWLGSVLSKQIRIQGESELSSELIEILKPDNGANITSSFGAKSLILIKSDAEQRSD